MQQVAQVFAQAVCTPVPPIAHEQSSVVSEQVNELQLQLATDEAG